MNGLRGRNNDQQIDGQNNNDNSIGGPGLFVSDTEFVQQYVLVTSQFGPEYGRNAGSVVNIITKSGSNAWHGSVYEHENNTWSELHDELPEAVCHRRGRQSSDSRFRAPMTSSAVSPSAARWSRTNCSSSAASISRSSRRTVFIPAPATCPLRPGLPRSPLVFPEARACWP